MIGPVVFQRTAGGEIPVCARRTPNGASERTPARTDTVFSGKNGRLRRKPGTPFLQSLRSITFRLSKEDVNRSLGSSGIQYGLLVSLKHRTLEYLAGGYSRA